MPYIYPVDMYGTYEIYTLSGTAKRAMSLAYLLYYLNFWFFYFTIF